MAVRIFAPSVHIGRTPTRCRWSPARCTSQACIFYDRLRNKLNERQENVLERMFREGIDGFKGGLSAENTISITGAPRTTVTRDLNDLVAKGALTKTGRLKYTRYHLNISLQSGWFWGGRGCRIRCGEAGR